MRYNRCQWKGAGAVERARLENEYTLAGIEGSNPSLSAVEQVTPSHLFFVSQS